MSAQQNQRSIRPIAAPRADAEAEQLSARYLVASMQGKRLDRRLAYPVSRPRKYQSSAVSGCFKALYPMEKNDSSPRQMSGSQKLGYSVREFGVESYATYADARESCCQNGVRTTTHIV